MFCMKCGTKLPNEAKFCFQCGFKIVTSEQEREIPSDKEPIIEHTNFLDEAEKKFKEVDLHKDSVLKLESDTATEALEHAFTYLNAYVSNEKDLNILCKLGRDYLELADKYRNKSNKIDILRGEKYKSLALECFSKAGDVGIFDLAVLLFKDEKRNQSLSLFRKYGDSGHPEGYFWVGMIYHLESHKFNTLSEDEEEIVGVDGSRISYKEARKQAIGWYKKASVYGYSWGDIATALLLQEELPISPNQFTSNDIAIFDTVLALLKKAVNAGNPWAMYKMAVLFLEGFLQYDSSDIIDKDYVIKLCRHALEKKNKGKWKNVVFDRIQHLIEYLENDYDTYKLISEKEEAQSVITNILENTVSMYYRHIIDFDVYSGVNNHSIYFNRIDEISGSRMNGALTTYAGGCELTAEDVLILQDDTFLNDGEKGFLITLKGIVSSLSWRKMYSYQNIKDAYVAGDSLYLLLNSGNSVCICNSGYAYKKLPVIANMLKSILSNDAFVKSLNCLKTENAINEDKDFKVFDIPDAIHIEEIPEFLTVGAPWDDNDCNETDNILNKLTFGSSHVNADFDKNPENNKDVDNKDKDGSDVEAENNKDADNEDKDGSDVEAENNKDAVNEDKDGFGVEAENNKDVDNEDKDSSDSEGNNESPLYDAGLFFENNQSLSEDDRFEEAYKYYKMAADAGDKRAISKLIYFNEHGYHVSQDNVTDELSTESEQNEREEQLHENREETNNKSSFSSDLDELIKAFEDIEKCFK